MTTLGTRRGPLTVYLAYGAGLHDTIELRDADGNPQNWPVGTTAHLLLSARSGFSAIWVATVTGSILEWDITAAMVNLVPMDAMVSLVVVEPGEEPNVLLCGAVDFSCCGEGPICGFSESVLVGLPGPQGPAGPQGPPGSGGPGGDAEQVVVNGLAAVPLSGQIAVTRRPNGTIEPASNTNPAHTHLPIWITTGAVGAGLPVTAVAFGEMVEPLWNWSAGQIFLGVNGGLTQTPPTAPAFIAQIGSSTDPDRMFVDRFSSVIPI